MGRRVTDLESSVQAPSFARRVLDSFPDLISYVDADERYRYVNRGYQDWFGITPSEIEGRTMRDILGDEAYERVKPYARRAFRGEKVFYTETMPYRLGAPHQIEARLIPDIADDGSVKGVFALVRDVGDRERLQDEMLSVLDGLDACFIALDPDDRLTFINAAAVNFQKSSGLKIFGERPTLLGRRLWEINPAGLGGIMHRAIERVRATGKPEAFEYIPLFRPDRVVDMRVFPTPSGAVGVSYIDVTERRRAEEELRRNEERLQIANTDLEARVRSEIAERLKAVEDRERFWALSQDLYAVLTLSDGLVRRVNAEAWKATLGYDQDQLMGVSLREFTHPDDLDRTLETVAKLDQVPMIELENRYRHADGSWRWLSWKVTRDGVLSYAAARDVTEEKAREEQVRRSQKLEALGQLTGGVAHDFNNVLTVIMGALDLLQKRPGDTALGARLVPAALAAAKRGELLNKQLLGFARKQASHQQFVVPSKLLEEMAPLIKGALSDMIALKLETASETRGAMVDPAQFEATVLNLVVNARDAMPAGGTLRISVRPAEASEVRRLGLPSAAYLVLEVADTGTGMSPEVLSHAFEPFFTTKEVGKGSGLGLAQVYGFTRQAAGAVDIRTEPGRGTTVLTYLPAADPPAVADEPDAGETATGPRRRILLVEDDPLVGAVTESMLADMGHLVTRVEHAAGALDALSRTEFDLLFTDVRMPGGRNGVQLALEATRTRPNLKVLLCSGWTDDLLGAETLGAKWPLLAKPFDVLDLERALRGVLAA
jgi:PAS domain S-box-containing protein